MERAVSLVFVGLAIFLVIKERTVSLVVVEKAGV
jgi:hypothetical protein